MAAERQQVARLQGRVQAKRLIGSLRAEWNEGVQFGMGQSRPRQMLVLNVIENAIPPAADDFARSVDND